MRKKKEKKVGNRTTHNNYEKIRLQGIFGDIGITFVPFFLSFSLILISKAICELEILNMLWDCVMFSLTNHITYSLEKKDRLEDSRGLLWLAIFYFLLIKVTVF